MEKDNKIHRKGYTSELDQFFHEFDENRTDFPKSRVEEIAKFKRIFEMRDPQEKQAKKD